MSYTPSDFQSTGALPRSSQAVARAREAERVAAHNRLLLQMNAADDTERRLGVDKRWTSDQPKYQQALQYIQNREFIRVVERLEGLVVQ